MKKRNTNQGSTFGIAVLVSIGLFIIGCANSDQDRPQWNIQYFENDTMQLKVQYTNVQAAIRSEKYEHFTGYVFSLKGAYIVKEIQDSSVLIRFEPNEFILDTLRDRGSMEEGLNAYTTLVNKKIAERNFEYRVSLNWDRVFLDGLKDIDQILRDILSTEEFPSFGDDRVFSQAEQLFKSQRSFKGQFVKGLKWQDETQSIYHELKDESNILNMDWELLRFNENEMTFYGTGKSNVESFGTHKEMPEKVARHQYSINTVMDRNTNWIKMGTLDLREERSVISPKIDKETQDTTWIKTPYGVHNYRIKYLPIR
jgi:hypothetical protein